MYYYRIKIKYEGTNYAGFQWQSGLCTVQGEINSALTKIINGKFSTIGTSRTDTGVHALEQIVKITSSELLLVSTFVDTFNKTLPRDIRCTEISSCPGSFKPAACAVSKEYLYFFTNKRSASKEETQFIANISNPLNIEAMKTCMKALVGVHDFCNFYSQGSNVKSTIRTVRNCELSLVNPQYKFNDNDMFRISDTINECYQIRIEADGFLKQMIRHIVGALWRVGSGKISIDDFLLLLNGEKSEKQRWKVASPNGLFLYRINFNSN